MTWHPTLSTSVRPIYIAIAEQLAADIATGKLQPGARLPPQRELAGRLGVDLTTVTRGFAEAASRGLIVSEGRRGTFVRAAPRSEDRDAPVNEASSGMNMPPEPEDGSLRQRIADGMTALMKERTAPLHYQSAGGTEVHRRSTAFFLSHLIPNTATDQCLVTAGSQHALYALLSLMMEPGDRIAVGQFAYPGFLAAARRLRLSLAVLPMDERGIDPDALEAAAREGQLKAVYVVPTNDNPTAATLPASRRKAIASIARQFGFAVIEDDAYGRLPEQPVAPIAASAPERTWHIATTSKLVSPSLRIGFVRAPGVREALSLAAVTHETSGMAPPLNAALVSQWVEDGTFLRLLHSIRAEARARTEEAVRILGSWQPTRHPDGYHLWVPLPDGVKAERVAMRAVAAGLPAVASSAFAATTEPVQQALRVSLGGSAPRPRLRRELERLDAFIAESARSTLV